ncbi:MAG: glycosyltransferase family 4 protein [Chloroflexota bacterium]|nr:glycosyltransferase family 4 protein [Chloroflexota bacterium]
MHIGIYNRWLPTLGGGERYTLDFARVFARDGHQVELLTHQPLELAAIQERLALDLERIQLRNVPDSPGNERVSAASANYDLFLNLSHGDLFRSQARRSALVVHFPAPLEAYVMGGVPVSLSKAALVPSRVTWLSGTYPPETDGLQSWTWTGPRARIEVARCWPLPARTLVIRLADLLPPSIAAPPVRLYINGRRIAERSDAWTTWRMALPKPARRGQTLTVELEMEPWTLRRAGLAADDRERGVPLHSVGLVHNRLEERLAAQSWSAFHTTRRSLSEVERALGSYTIILANSRFTQRWIERRWQRRSEVLYPAVDVAAGPAQATRKGPGIISVGRFFAGAHNKQHLPMIEAFRALCDAGLRGWEYHLVGGCDLDQPAQRAYLRRVQAATVGYPIQVHVNAPLATVRQLYSSASLFWHAAGFGEDEERNPDAVEHFGITTIEAMAAACVPVVIAKGGQVETVEAGVSGLLWHTLAELQVHTRLLIEDAALRERLAAGARVRSQQFSFQVFAARVQDVFD